MMKTHPSVDRSQMKQNPLLGPYGVRAPNGINLSRSVGNPKSRFARVIFCVWALNRIGVYPTKRQILSITLGKQLDTPSAYMKVGVIARGYASGFFSTLVKAGFLFKLRDGKTVRYTLGPEV